MHGVFAGQQDAPKDAYAFVPGREDVHLERIRLRLRPRQSALNEKQEIRNGPTKATTGVLCLEGEWEPDLRKRASVLPVLELLERLGVIKSIHRNVATPDELSTTSADFRKPSTTTTEFSIWLAMETRALSTSPTATRSPSTNSATSPPTAFHGPEVSVS